MKRFLVLLAANIFLFSTAFAQSDMDLTKYSSLKAVDDQVQDITDAVHSGMNVLDWTDGSGPTLFRVSVDVFAGFGSFDALPEIGLKDSGIAPGALGVQGGFGTAGLEAYVRYFPELTVSDVDVSSIGFGLKYEISKIMPIPMLPSTSVYVDYNTLSFGVNATRKGSVPYSGNNGTTNVSYEAKSGIDMAFSTINIGLIASYDLVLVRFYGKLAYEIGSTDIDWNYVTAVSETEYEIRKNSDEFTNSGLRYGVGMSLFGIKAEAGGRGSNLYFGVGYGISI